jgi:hypothetical protein
MQMFRRSIYAAAVAIAGMGFGGAANAQPYEPGVMGGYGPGPGMMQGYGGGYGPGMMGPGYGGGYGPGMMQGYGGGYGPGMMGPGYGYGPGMMQGYGGGYGPGYGMGGGRGYYRNQGNLNLSADDVKKFLAETIRNPNLKVGDVKEKDADTITAEIVTKDKDALVQRFEFNRHNGFYQPEQ